MRKFKKALGLTALAITLSATPVLAESNVDVVPYIMYAQCDVCGYSRATATTSVGDWYTTGYFQHAGHTDEYRARDKFTTVTCPNCGSVKTYKYGTETDDYCPYGLNR